MEATNATIALPDYASWLTTEAVATTLGVSPVVVNAWIVTGIKTETGRVFLKAVKIGGRWKVDPAWVKAFVDATTKAALSPSAIAANASDQSDAPPERPAPPAKPTKLSERTRRAEAAMAIFRNRGHHTA